MLNWNSFSGRKQSDTQKSSIGFFDGNTRIDEVVYSRSYSIKVFSVDHEVPEIGHFRVVNCSANDGFNGSVEVSLIWCWIFLQFPFCFLTCLLIAPPSVFIRISIVEKISLWYRWLYIDMEFDNTAVSLLDFWPLGLQHKLWPNC